MKTLRLIITLDCNLSCEYCCNNIPEVKDKFQYKKLEDINFKNYDSICITGGEPLLNEDFIRNTLLELYRWSTPKQIYIYTNGLLLTRPSIAWAFDGINIGLHSREQFETLLDIKDIDILNRQTITFFIQDIKVKDYPEIPKDKIKTWSLNECFNNADTEDLVVLKD